MPNSSATSSANERRPRSCVPESFASGQIQSPEEVLQTLIDGVEVGYSVTLPPGLRIRGDGGQSRRGRSGFGEALH